jgi:endoglucanase
MIKKTIQVTCIFCLLFMNFSFGQKLKLNDLEYFETQGVNILVFSSQYNGMFFDEKTAAIEIIHHGVRTSTGGAVRLQNTPEQWDLVPMVVNRKVDKANKIIDVELSYKELNFNSKISVLPKIMEWKLMCSLISLFQKSWMEKPGLTSNFYQPPTLKKRI